MKHYIMVALLVFLVACSPSVCKDLQGEAFNLCVIDEAVATQDAALCLHLPAGGYREWCVNDVANATKSSEPCALLEDVRSREYCMRDRFLAEGDVNRCAELTSADTQDSCLDKFATQLNSWEPCVDMRRSASKDACLERMARSLKDPYGCVEMSFEYDGRDPCLFSLSISTHTVETCAEMNDHDGYIYCHINLASYYGNESICDLMGEEEAAFCHTFLAQLPDE